MIVTFHLAVYFVYNVWETYFSGLFRSNASNLSDNENDNTRPNSPVNTSTNQNNAANARQDVEGSQPSPTGNLSRSNVELPNKEGEGEHIKENDNVFPILQRIEFEDREEGKKAIYDEEPTFECQVSEEKGMQFIPPVYIQRYAAIENIFKEPCWTETLKKVVDFGCAELSLELRYLKKLFGVREILAVDIDAELLDKYKNKAFPTRTDYLEPRPTPLKIRVFCGSVGTTHEALMNADAVIAIELVEHLYPDDLECLPFTIFGYIRPKVVVFTTPNADFNVLFPGFTGFRHDDHKFEWSRQQFEDWCNNLVQRYSDYSVTFQGVGPGPAGTENLGCCSQMATFVKLYNSYSPAEHELHAQDGEYTLIEEAEYPFFFDTRTREERIRDDALNFLQRCSILRRVDQYDSDEEKNKKHNEVPFNAVMDRVKCYNRQKLRNILTTNNWEITTNEAGYEVVILPEIDDGDGDTSSETDAEYNDVQNNDTLDCIKTLPSEENWDCDEKTESKEVCLNSTVSTLNSDTPTCCLWDPDKNVPSPNNSVVSIEVENTAQPNILACKTLDDCHDNLCSLPDIVPGDSYDPSLKNEESEGTDLDYSVYETPYSKFNSGSKVLNSNVPNKLLHQSQPNTQNICKRALSFDATELNEPFSGVTDKRQAAGDPRNNISCVSDDMSSFNVSLYSTPCCSQIPKCLSLQQINTFSGSPFLRSELSTSVKDQTLTWEQKDGVSTSLDQLKNQEICEMHESFSNCSKVVDSGYPDSYTEHDMELDLTPEQFDDFETESDGNESDSLPSPLAPAPLIPHLMDDVENGDVANNNRDGEGNNVIADMEEEALEFEAQIEEFFEVPNFAAADNPDLEFSEFSNERISSDEENGDCPGNFKSPKAFTTSDKPSLDQTETHSVDSSNIVVKSVQSGSSLATNSSWSYKDFLGGQICCDNPENTKFDNKQDPNKLKTQSSLTTVLDGYSKFSSCSIVRPIDKNQIHTKSPEEIGNDRFPKWLLKISKGVLESGDDKVTPQENHISSPLSEYLSVESFDDDCSGFPAWLLGIQLDTMDDDEYDQDSRRSFMMSLSDNDSLQETVQEFGIQVDVRGGGDPLRDNWL